MSTKTYNTNDIIEQTDQYGAKNYKPLPIVISEAEGVWVKDPEGKEYMDMLSSYSALNQGHRHPKVMEALRKQSEKVSKLTGKDMVLPMNSGAEAVETALKAARRWGYDKKGIAEDQAEIIACEDNFHGRTMAAVSLSSDPDNKRGYGPMLPGLKVIPYGDVEALKEAITPNTAAFLFEPIQGEAGINLPPEGFLKEAYDVC